MSAQNRIPLRLAEQALDALDEQPFTAPLHRAAILLHQATRELLEHERKVEDNRLARAVEAFERDQG